MRVWSTISPAISARSMSVMGQERTLAALDFMSALPPITDIAADMGDTDLTSEVIWWWCIAWWWRFRWWRLRRFVRERNWRNDREWFRGWLCRWLGYLGLDHNTSSIPLIVRYIPRFGEAFFTARDVRYGSRLCRNVCSLCCAARVRVWMIGRDGFYGFASGADLSAGFCRSKSVLAGYGRK